MAKKIVKQARSDQYRAIAERYGIREYKVLAFAFKGLNGPEKFHFELMRQARHLYYFFDEVGNNAYVIIPPISENEAICIKVAESCGGEKITPNLQ